MQQKIHFDHDSISLMCCNLCCVASEHESYPKYRYFFVFVTINGSKQYKHMGKVVIKILQGSAVTQTVLGGLTTHLPVANFL